MRRADPHRLLGKSGFAAIAKFEMSPKVSNWALFAYGIAHAANGPTAIFAVAPARRHHAHKAAMLWGGGAQHLAGQRIPLRSHQIGGCAIPPDQKYFLLFPDFKRPLTFVLPEQDGDVPRSPSLCAQRVPSAGSTNSQS